MQEYVISGDFVANLTQDLAKIDMELDQAITVFDRTFWILVLCSIFSVMLVIMDLYKLYRKKCGKKEYLPAAAQIPDCEGQRV